MAKGSRRMQLEKGASLQMMRTLFSGQIHQGIVAVPSSGSVSSALMQYMQDSEQVLSVIAVGCRVRDHEIVEAGGYIVQLLPEVKEAPLAVMTERLRDFESMDPLFDGGNAAPAKMLSEILYAMPYTLVGEDTVALGGEIEKLAVWSGGEPVGRAEVEQLAAPGREATAWALTDAWGQRDLPACDQQRVRHRVEAFGLRDRTRPTKALTTARYLYRV